MSIHLVEAGSVWPFLEFLQSVGSPTGRLLARAEIPDCAFESAEHLLPLRSLTRFVELSARREGMHLGLEVGRRTLMEQFGAYGRLVLCSNTLGQAAAIAQRYSRLYNPGLRIRFSIGRKMATLQQEYPREYGAGYLQLHAYTLMLTIQQVRQWLGSDWAPQALHVDPVLARELRRYEDLADCRFVEGRGPMGMSFGRELLALPVPDNGYTGDPRSEVAKLHRTAPPLMLVPVIEQLVRTYLPMGAPPIEHLASVLNKSVRTLQRELARRGTSLTAIVDSARRDRAIELISGDKVSVMEAALACGYADSANFTRAFRRWTGRSPRAFGRCAQWAPINGSNGSRPP